LTQKIQTIIDNRSLNTLLNALEQLFQQTQHLDLATGCFEIGSLMALDGHWQAIDKMRIIMGDETTKRTKKELVQSVISSSHESIEEAKERDDNLGGLVAIREALNAKRILTRIYSKAKFHAKCYIMNTREQRRLLYVSLTRAREHLIVSWPTTLSYEDAIQNNIRIDRKFRKGDGSLVTRLAKSSLLPDITGMDYATQMSGAAWLREQLDEDSGAED